MIEIEQKMEELIKLLKKENVKVELEARFKKKNESIGYSWIN